MFGKGSPFQGPAFLEVLEANIVRNFDLMQPPLLLQFYTWDEEEAQTGKGLG